MNYRLLSAIALAGLISSCSTMPGDSVYDQSRPPMVPVPPGVGGEYTDSMPMLSDPEAEAEEWADEVYAPDLATAKARCQNVANNAGGVTEVLDVTQTTKTPNRQGNFRFTCWLKSETGGSPSGTDSSSDTQY